MNITKTAIVLAGCLFSSTIFAATTTAAPSTPADKTTWDYIKGYTPPNAFYLGMWSIHTNQKSRREDNWNNQLVGVLYKSFFAGTFKNSFYDRSYAMGIQRDVYQKTFANGIADSFGYRAGGIYGYDGRLGRIAAETPVLPFIQLLYDVHYHHVGAEISYTGVVFSASFYFTF